MMQGRLKRSAVFACIAIGCSAESTTEGETMKLSHGLVSSSPRSLPDPSVSRGPYWEPSTAAQVERHDEVQRYLANGYHASGYRIVETIQLPSGDIVDWVDADSVPGSRIEKPPPPAGTRSQAPLMELEEHSDLRGPEETIPIHRPTFRRYIEGRTSAVSIQDFIANHMVHGQPAGQFRLYGGRIVTDEIIGSNANLSLWRTGTIEDNTFSLQEISVYCDGSSAGDVSVIGAAVSRDRANFGDEPTDPSDPKLRLQIESFTINGGSTTGGWAIAPYSRWVTALGAPYGPGAAFSDSTISEIDGDQFVSKFQWKLDNGNWWLWHQSNWLGYFPASYLEWSGTSGEACKTAYYGEVFDSSPTSWTDNDMGSGLFAVEGWQRAATIDAMFYCDNSSPPTCPWVTDTLSNVTSMGPIDSACYTTGAIHWTTDGDPRFFLGGPGGDEAGCN